MKMKNINHGPHGRRRRILTATAKKAKKGGILELSSFLACYFFPLASFTCSTRGFYFMICDLVFISIM
jgi:hypothetical protein